MPSNPRSKIVSVLESAASRIAGVEVGIACAGTSLEAKTFRAGTKSFLFIGPRDARLKLTDSLTDVSRRAAEDPDALAVGKGGWLTIRFDAAKPPDAASLRRWVEESHRAVAAPAARAAAAPRARKAK